MAATIEKELEEVKGKWQQTQQQLDKNKSELHDVREELERSQSQLDEVLGELEQTHFELHQLKEKGGEQHLESDSEVKQDLEETKTKLQETEQLLEQSQSKLGETMGVLEEYQSQMEKTMVTLEESQGKLQQKQQELEQVKTELAQKQSGSDAELQKELEETKSELKETEELLEQYQSQLEETMKVLEESHSQLEQAQLREKQEQQQSGSESELHKELEETKAKLRETEELLEESQSQLQQTQKQLKQKNIELLKIKGVDSVKVTQELMKIIQKYITEEGVESQKSKFAKGSIQQRQRVVQVAEYCAQNFPGDFIEIGCLSGETTKLLAEVAKKYDRKVIALDPWETGTQNCQGGEYEAFLKNIEPYKDYVDIIRASSLDEKAINLVNNRQLSFAFVDGLHTYDACLVDIQTVYHCFGIIAVDDILWSTEVENAFYKGAEIINRQKLYLPVCREGYLLPSSI